MIRVNKKLLLTAAFLALVAIVQLGTARFVSAAPKGTLKMAIHWGLSGEYNDPSLAGSYMSTFNLYLFHDALLKPMPDGRYSPSLAESWTVSPDFKVYEFKLRQGVKFHNGDELTAEDVCTHRPQLADRKVAGNIRLL